MNNRRKFAADKEAILMALDQLSQTMEVMGQVVSRLRRSVEQAHIAEQTILSSSELSNQGYPRSHSSLSNVVPHKPRTEEKQYSNDEVATQSIVIH